jgi:CheY-like chemotaxis protein
MNPPSPIHPGATAPRRTGSILLVDDDAAICQSLGIRLRSCGFEVRTAQDGIDATRQALASAPELLILDINMPAGDGFAVLERVRESPATAGTPVIVLTASQKPGLRERALSSGANAYFRKPYESWDLLRTIDRLLDR